MTSTTRESGPSDLMLEIQTMIRNDKEDNQDTNTLEMDMKNNSGSAEVLPHPPTTVVSQMEDNEV